MTIKRYLLTALTLLAVHYYAAAQYNPYWQWAKADTGYVFSAPGNSSVLAAKNGDALWARMTIVKMNSSNGSPMGEYFVSEYDSTGRQLGALGIGGKVELYDAQADASGNWYVLGRFYDSLVLPNTTYTRAFPATNPDPDHFMMRIKGKFMTVDWVKIIGGSKDVTARSFTLDNSQIYLPADSLNVATIIYGMSSSNGAMTPLFRQDGKSSVTSIQTDAFGSIYLAGSCADKGGINFNGTMQPGMLANSYAYIVKYRPNRTHAWHQWMRDPMCAQRKLTLFQNGFLYYTGSLNDSLTLGNLQLRQPANPMDYVAARLDTGNGNVLWARQVDSGSGGGGASLGAMAYHAVATPDTALVMFAQATGFIDWRNNVSTNLPNMYAATAVSIAPTSDTRWARPILGENTSDSHIAADGDAVWVCGNAYSSTGIVRLDTLKLKVPALAFVPYMAKLKLTRPKPTTPPPGAVTGGHAGDALHIYPVPARTTLLIGGLQGRCQLVLRDISGQAVLEMSTSAQQAVMNVSALPRGAYFLHLLDENGVQAVRRVVLQ